MAATTPEQAIELFSAALNCGDIDSLMELYEPGAVFAPRAGETVSGQEQIREAIERFLAIRPRMTGSIEKLITAGDVALVANRWRLAGTGPDGEPIEMSGISADVVRRQPDGKWLVAIDDPWGGAG